jgi:hypothetical protein
MCVEQAWQTQNMFQTKSGTERHNLGSNMRGFIRQSCVICKLFNEEIAKM